MDSTEWIWLTAIIAGFAGLISGWLLGRRTNTEQRKSLALQDSLLVSEQQLRDYKHEVQDHFAQTADAFKQLNESYQNLHQQLAKGANSLCGDVPGGPMLDQPAAKAANKPGTDTQQHQPFGPPLDYAPKKGPKDIGVLNEDFGLEKVRVPGNPTRG